MSTTTMMPKTSCKASMAAAPSLKNVVFPSKTWLRLGLAFQMCPWVKGQTAAR
jgi:hypothetical protein